MTALPHARGPLHGQERLVSDRSTRPVSLQPFPRTRRRPEPPPRTLLPGPPPRTCCRLTLRDKVQGRERLTLCRKAGSTLCHRAHRGGTVNPAPDTTAADNGGDFDPRQAAALLDQTVQQTRRQI